MIAQPKPSPEQQEFFFIVFALMGANIDQQTACALAANGLISKGYSQNLIDQARAAVESRIAQWGRP